MPTTIAHSPPSHSRRDAAHGGHPLEKKLAQVRRRMRLTRFARGACRTVSVAIPAVLALGMIDYFCRFEDLGMRLIGSLAAIAAIVWGTIRFLLPALHSPLNRVSLARRIDEHFAPGATSGATDHIASAIEFLAEDELDPLAGSATLRRAAVAQAQARLGDADWLAIVDRRPVLRTAALAALFVAAATGITLWRPAEVRLALVRLANPFDSAAWPPVNDLEFRHRIERVAVGQSFEVELIDRNRRLPDEVWIEYRAANAEGREQIDRRPMQLIGDMMVARKENVATSFDYRAEGGDDRRMGWTHVEVVEPPRIKDFKITLHPPSYTGWPARPAAQRIVALRGTVVEIAASVTKPLTAAVLHQQNGPDVPCELAANGYGFQLRAEARNKSPQLIIDKSGPYWFELRDRDDMVGGLSDRWDIQAIGDRPPTVDLRQPESNLYVTPRACGRREDHGSR